VKLSLLGEFVYGIMLILLSLSGMWIAIYFIDVVISKGNYVLAIPIMLIVAGLVVLCINGVVYTLSVIYCIKESGS